MNRFARFAWASLTLAALLPALGCRSEDSVREHGANPALRAIESPAGASESDRERAALARLVGVWTFEGWTSRGGEERRAGSGHAAGTIEDEHFVLMDLEATSAQLGGRSGQKSGSMLFASEPGVGLTLTAWGDASPSVTRLVGTVEGNGSAFTLREMRTPSGQHQHRVTITFQTDDRWTAEIRDSTASGDPVVARYEFRRAGT